MQKVHGEGMTTEQVCEQRWRTAFHNAMLVGKQPAEAAEFADQCVLKVHGRLWRWTEQELVLGMPVDVYVCHDWRPALLVGATRPPNTLIWRTMTVQPLETDETFSVEAARVRPVREAQA